MEPSYLLDDKGFYVLDFTEPYISEFASKLLEGRLWFGKYPTPSELNLLKDFTHVIDLCTIQEVTWEPYTPPESAEYIKYPIEDGSSQTPISETSSNIKEWTTLKRLCKNIVDLLDDTDNKIYVHCKGGHGRSATVCAIVYGMIKDVGAKESMKVIHAAHQARKTMDAKWRKLGSPQRAKQKLIIKSFLEN